jgi:hypothetical protein
MTEITATNPDQPYRSESERYFVPVEGREPVELRQQERPTVEFNTPIDDAAAARRDAMEAAASQTPESMASNEDLRQAIDWNSQTVVSRRELALHPELENTTQEQWDLAA